MPLKKTQVNFSLDLSDEIKKVPTEKRQAVKEKIAKLLKDEVIGAMKREESPVTGEKWQPLSNEYKKIKASKGKGKLANLKLTGSLRDSIESRVSGNKVQIGIWGSSTDKKKGFNHATGDTLPARRWIPDDEGEARPLKGQRGRKQFHSSVINKIREVINASKD